MTTISAKVILDSISEEGKRLTTLHLRYPRFIHAELLTHRVFSRNARSSRAVPVKTMLEEIKTDPVVPLFWGKNQKGMQASEECNELVDIRGAHEDGDLDQLSRQRAWLWARDRAVEAAEAFMNAGYHKQVVNRLLEPFMHIDTLVSATEWANFLYLRDHKDAEPHIQLLAQAVKAAMDQSTPKLLKPGEWHLPYIEVDDWNQINDMLRGDGHPVVSNQRIIPELQKLSAARCARISYKPFDGNASIEAELQRYDDLITSEPMHASPVEHQATPDEVFAFTSLGSRAWLTPRQHGNFVGWIQFRKTLPNEARW